MDVPRANNIDVPAAAVTAAAEALWGARWQSDMARILQVDLRRVQRIAAAARDGKPYPLPRGLLERLLGELEAKHFPLQRAYEDLRLVYEGL